MTIPDSVIGESVDKATSTLQGLGLQVAGPYGPKGQQGALDGPGPGDVGAPGDHRQPLHPVREPVAGCELCEAARLTEWFHEDDICWVAACEVCDVPMVVWKCHGQEPPEAEVEHMLGQLGVVADARPGHGTAGPSTASCARSPTTSTPTPATPTGGSAGSAASDRPRSSMVIKYLGSKRRLVPALTVLAAASGARTGLDLFCGTTRVAQAWKRLGITSPPWTAPGSPMCWPAATWPPIRGAVRRCPAETADAVEAAQLVVGRPGYVTEPPSARRPGSSGPRTGPHRCHPRRHRARLRRHPLWPVLMTSLLEAADRVDSTTGVQMAYLKEWAPRADDPLPSGCRAGPGARPRCGGMPASGRRVTGTRRRRSRLPRSSLQPAPL